MALSALTLTLPASLPTAAQAQPANPYAFLDLPVVCDVGRECWIFNYVDHDSGPGARDYACGPRTYDGHAGTDFAVRDLAAMHAGVRVVAAAAGTVRNTRDGMPDGAFDREIPGGVQDRECGNGVVIDHGNGWETQYCHMMSGSVHVRPGQRVAAGDHLGYVGMSGKAEFPHLHLAVRQDGRQLDPFLGPDPGEARACRASETTLWRPEAEAAVLPYSPADIFASGFSEAVPAAEAVYAGEAARSSIPADAGALVGWSVIAGVRAGDRLSMRIADPSGREVVDQTVTIERDRARHFQYMGRKRSGAAWPAGNYRLSVVLERAVGEAIVERRAEATVPVR